MPCPSYAADDGPPHGAKRTGSVLTAILSAGIRGPVCRAPVGPGSQCSLVDSRRGSHLRAGSAQRIRSQTGEVSEERHEARCPIPACSCRDADQPGTTVCIAGSSALRRREPFPGSPLTNHSAPRARFSEALAKMARNHPPPLGLLDAISGLGVGWSLYPGHVPLLLQRELPLVTMPQEAVRPSVYFPSPRGRTVM